MHTGIAKLYQEIFNIIYLIINEQSNIIFYNKIEFL